jgi:hypothetical protein
VPATTPCTKVVAPPSDTAVDTVLYRERGVLTYSYSDPASGGDRTFTIDYELDTACRRNPGLAKLIDHVLEATAEASTPPHTPSPVTQPARRSR